MVAARAPSHRGAGRAGPCRWFGSRSWRYVAWSRRRGPAGPGLVETTGQPLNRPILPSGPFVLVIALVRVATLARMCALRCCPGTTRASLGGLV